MSIASGYKKFKKYILTSSGFQLVSHWTKANTLEFDDGKTAQDKLGAIDGISSSRESNSDKIAASTALVSELNSDLGGLLTPKILYDAAIKATGDFTLKTPVNNYSLIIFCGSMIVNNELSHFTALIPASMLLNINSAVNCLIIGDTRISSASNQYSGYIKVFMKNANILSIAEINGKNSSSIQLYKILGL